MSANEDVKPLSACPACGNRQSYLARRCGSCGRQHSPAEMLRIAGGLLEIGTSLRSLRRQISEAGRGIGAEIVEAAAELFNEHVESTSVIALIAARDFGDPRSVSFAVLDQRFRHASQALRVEIAQTLLAAQTDETMEIIRRLKDVEKDAAVRRAFEEPLVSSEGMSLSLETNLMGGKPFDMKPKGPAESDEKAAAQETVVDVKQKAGGQGEGGSIDVSGPAAGGAAKKPAGTDQAPAATAVFDDDVEVEAVKSVREEEVEGEALIGEESAPAGDEEEGEVRVALKTDATIPPPLPAVMPEGEEGDKAAAPAAPAAAATAATGAPPQAVSPVPPRPAAKRDYSVLLFTAIGIVLLGAIIGYGVIRYGKSRSAEGEKMKEAVGGGKTPGKAEDAGNLEEVPALPVEPTGKEVKGPESHIITGSVTASSEHSKYVASNIMDGDPATVWQEDKSRKPFGEWVKLSFDSDVTVTRIGIVVGFDYIDGEGKDYFPLNCRLKEAELIFSTGDTEKIYLDDTRNIQYVTIDPPRKTRLIRITVFDVYRGSWFFDNAIGEVEVWGYEENEEPGAGGGASAE
jgi:hypothetical protein